MIGQHCLTHSHKLIIGKLISASNWHLVHLFNLQDLGPTLGPKSGRVEIKLYKNMTSAPHNVIIIPNFYHSLNASSLIMRIYGKVKKSQRTLK